MKTLAAPPLGKSDGERETTKLPRLCPICGKPAAPATRPFCSRRCADIDLHRWLSGSYAIPVSAERETTEPGMESRETESPEG
jgi:endogenous inhibitor of DNA gyrase (YacG/DUF329 family)